MRTAIVSDLHLGSTSGEDLLRDAGIRRAFLEKLDGADRLVLLGDIVELRELPLASVLKSAQAFFEELGEAMAGRTSCRSSRSPNRSRSSMRRQDYRGRPPNGCVRLGRSVDRHQDSLLRHQRSCSTSLIGRLGV